MRKDSESNEKHEVVLIAHCTVQFPCCFSFPRYNTADHCNHHLPPVKCLSTEMCNNDMKKKINLNRISSHEVMEELLLQCIFYDSICHLT